MPKSDKNQLKIGTGVLTGFLLRSIIVIGDNTPTWNDAADNPGPTPVKLCAGDIFGKDGVDFTYLARSFGQWDPRLAEWLAGLGKGKKPLPFDTLAAYFRVAAQKHGKCTVLLYSSEQVLARYGAANVLGFIERTKGYCWYVLIGDESLDGLEIPRHMRPRRIDVADFTLTLQEMKVYFSASGILLTPQQYEMLHQLVGGWTLAAYMVNNHMKRGERLQQSDIDLAITGVFGELDDLLMGSMDLHEHHTATLLSEFETFPYGLAIACCPYSEGVVRKTLEKVPGVRFTNNGAALAMHPLLRAYWQTKRYDLPKKLRDGCKTRAAKWYAANKNYMAALECAIDAQEYVLTREIIVKMDARLRQQHAGGIARLMERMGTKALQLHPVLWAYKVALYYSAVETGAAEKEKAALEHFLAGRCDTREARQAKGEMLLLSGFLNITNPSSISFFAQAAECFGGSSEISDTYMNDTVCNGTLVPYAGSEKYTLLDTCKIIQRAAPHRYKATNNWGRGHEHLCMAEFGYLTGDAQMVIENANRAITDAMAYQQWDVAGMANHMLFLQYGLLGEANEAIDTWRMVHTLAQMNKSGGTVVKDIADACMFFNSRQLYLLPSWVRDAGAFRAKVKCYQPGREYYLRAFYLLCKGRLHNALRLVCEAMGCTSFTDEWIMRLHLLVLKMMIYVQLGDMAQAQALLNRCYKLAAPEQLAMLFTGKGKAMAKVMDTFLGAKKAGENSELPPVAWMEAMGEGALEMQRGMDAMFNGYYKWLQAAHGTNLTGNEYIVLQMFCLGHTKESVTEELGVGKNYTNSVMRRVCKKLGVGSFEEAVAHGRSINIQAPINP